MDGAGDGAREAYDEEEHADERTEAGTPRSPKQQTWDPWLRRAVVDSDDTVSLVDAVVGGVVSVVVEDTALPRVPLRLRECRRLDHNNHKRRILAPVLAYQL